MSDRINNDAITTYSALGRVLDDVNKIRLAIGIGEGKLKELPRGIRSNPNQCVLAKALSNGWEAEVDSEIRLSHYSSFATRFDWKKATKTLNELGLTAYFNGAEYSDEEYISIELTEDMSQLISDFDNGFIPFLVLND